MPIKFTDNVTQNMYFEYFVLIMMCLHTLIQGDTKLKVLLLSRNFGDPTSLARKVVARKSYVKYDFPPKSIINTPTQNENHSIHFVSLTGNTFIKWALLFLQKCTELVEFALNTNKLCKFTTKRR